MSYILRGFDDLRLANGSSLYNQIELTALQGDVVAGKVHSSQLLPIAKKRQNSFELRPIPGDNIKIKELSIYEYESDQKIDSMDDKYISFSFIIPAFQRGYRWETEQVHELLDDIYVSYGKYYNSKSSEEIKCYCLQPLVLKRSADFLHEFRVIDGQQRLTTISLILQALNKLVPRGRNFYAFIPITYEARDESKDYLYTVGEKCENAINSVKENGNALAGKLEEIVKKTIKCIGEEQPKDLNSRYMLNTYLYAYWYFWEIITGKRKDYFKFAGVKCDNDKDWQQKRFDLITEMLLESTSVIWYTIDNEKVDEHKVFEDFNSGKINLTGSELVKGIFMNPDNYLQNEDMNASASLLEVRQTMLGIQWDYMEKTLHNNEFWAFIPHQKDKEGEIDSSTHIDSILNMYTYFNIIRGPGKGKGAFNLEDPLFSFKKINEMIAERLAPEGTDKYNTMMEIWLEIKDVYTNFHEWFIGDDSLSDANSLYHRISLFKRIVVNGGDYKERYRTELRRMYSLYNKLTTHSKMDREKLLNMEIAERLLGKKEPKREDVENLIKTTTYGNAREVEAILLAFNLSTLEGAEAYGGRFPFYEFDGQKWHKEHIFATNTDLLSEDANELYAALVNVSETNAYDEYCGMTSSIVPDKVSYRRTINDINSIIYNQVSGDNKYKLNERLLMGDGDILENILRDDHMGNMALLIEFDNIHISRDSYKDKSKKIKERFKKGDFIPICTMNVFCDFYSEDDSYSVHWLYAKRLSYLKQMIDSVNDYLFSSGELING